MIASKIFQHKTVRARESQFNTLKMDSLEVFPNILAGIQTSLNNSSTIPHHSTKALEDAADSLRSEIDKMEKWIDSTRHFLQSLEDHNKILQKSCQTMTLAASHSLRPFPPFPLDIAQQIIHLSCTNDRKTILSVSLVSKQLHEWADDSLWSRIIFRPNQRHKLETFLDFFSKPDFLSSPQAKRIQSMGFGCSLPPNSTILFSLPNLKTFSIGRGQSLIWLRGASCPSLRQLSCSPLDISPSLSSFEFRQPIFQSITHLNMVMPFTMQHSRWLDADWSDLRNLSRLTHLNLDASSVRDDARLLALLKPALPDSLKLVVVGLTEKLQQSFHDVRTGLIDRRMVVSTNSKEPSMPWVLLIPGGNLSVDGWATVGFRGANILWAKGEALLKERNATLNRNFR
ncbi:hypothetical protein DL96DRAFT_1811647 [Flagelloscypha sp. PMI_526]|nr:hypothetical protein DL96DRAFT_1811647 [Flagelloscypha sp. PMI_526]